MNAGNSSKVQNIYNEDYESDFEFDSDIGEKRKARHDLAVKEPERKVFLAQKEESKEESTRDQEKFRRHAFLALDAYTRHKKLINEYVLCYKGATEKLKRNSSNYKTDHDIIRENHRFLWDDEDEANTWGQQLAKAYYDRLFKEYCLCDLSRYKDKKIGMRWRTEKELVLGKGQFFCGNVHCSSQDDLNSWEVLFGYVEHGQKKSALVKLRLCSKCSEKLHYGYKGKLTLKKKKGKSNTANFEADELSIPNDGKSEEENSVKTNDSDIWKQPIKEDAEPSKEDVFEEFLEDLFL